MTIIDESAFNLKKFDQQKILFEIFYYLFYTTWGITVTSCKRIEKKFIKLRIKEVVEQSISRVILKLVYSMSLKTSRGIFYKILDADRSQIHHLLDFIASLIITLSLINAVPWAWWRYWTTCISISTAQWICVNGVRNFNGKLIKIEIQN